MSRLRNFARRPFSDQKRFALSALLIVAVRLALSLFTFERVRRVLGNYGHNRYPDGNSPVTAERIIWAVDTASRYLLPKKPCLTKALVAQMLLSRNGYPTTLRIGVARTGEKGLQAHAWLEDGEQIVIGHLDNLALFTPLPPLENQRS